MGLDVYLSEIEGLNEDEKFVHHYDEETDTDNTGESISFPSALDPTHLFKVGYWRSSYNNGGINHILDATLGEDHNLWTLVDGFFSEEHSTFEPDWRVLRDRAVTLLMEWEDALAEHGAFAVTGIPKGFEDYSVKNEGEALSAFREQKAKYAKDVAEQPDGWHCPSYSSREGEFYLDGLNVRAIIPAKDGWFSAYIVYDAPDNYDWYTTALKIVVETCDYVLASGKRYALHWSY